MTWFKVDDSFHSHPKVLATSPAALGLWVVAGAWCGANLTDGFVPDHALARLLPDSGELAKELVSTGLWRRAKGGYRFHDWGDFNPKGVDVTKERDAARERMRKLRASRKVAGNGHTGRESVRAESEHVRPGTHNEHPVNTPVENPDVRDGKEETAGHKANRSGEQQANVRENFAARSQPRPDPTRSSSNEELEREARARTAPSSEPEPASRPDGLTSIPEDFAPTDAMRRWAISTFGDRLDLGFETAQFTSHFRSTGARRKSWPDAWQKWVRDSERRRAERSPGIALATNGHSEESTGTQRARAAVEAGRELQAMIDRGEVAL